MPAYPLLDPAALLDPHPTLHRMRAEDPVHWSDQLHAWVLTRYDDVAAALNDPRLSSKQLDVMLQYQLGGRDPAIVADYRRLVGGMMLLKDGDDHHRLRVLGNRGFTPSLLENFRPVIQWVVDRLLDKAAAGGRMDIVRDLAQPFPAAIIAELFNIPDDDQPRFQAWADDVVKYFGGSLGDPDADARAANAGAIELERYFLAMHAKRGGKPGIDLMGLFIAGQQEGKLTAAEVCCQCVLLLNAGHVTTIDQLSNAVYDLLTHPDQLTRLRAEPTLIRTAVEELIRFNPAVCYTRRTAVEDVPLRGKTIRTGDLVYLGLAAANRDPAVFPDADRLDLGRKENKHLSFGGGPHVCLGAGLARRELEIGLTTLLRRFPALALDPAAAPVRRCESLVFRGFGTLPVRLA